MVITLQEENKSAFKFYLGFIATVAVLAAGGFYAWRFVGQQLATVKQSKVDQSVQLNTAIFSDPRLALLEQFSEIVLEDDPVGRDNPFKEYVPATPEEAALMKARLAGTKKDNGTSTSQDLSGDEANPGRDSKLILP